MRGIKKAWLKVGAALVIAGIVLLYTNFTEGIASLRRSVDLYGADGDYDRLTGFDHIRTDYDFSLGSYMQRETSTEDKYGKTVDKTYHYYYVIPAYTEENTYWIGLEVPQQDEDIMEQITDASYAYLMGEESEFGYTYLTKSGCLKKMTDEHYSYLEAMFAEMGYTSDEIREMTRPYYIATFDEKKVKFTFLLAIGLLACGLVFLGLVPLTSLLKLKNAAGTVKTSVSYAEPTAPKGTLVIGNNSYPKEWFVHVDQYVRQNELEYAKQDLRSLTGITYEEAEQIVANWQKYYGC